MSAFLGPIHYWLYRKIQIEDQMTNVILKEVEKNGIPVTKLEEQANTRYGILLNQPLEDMIDTGNIHGWLQEKVSVAEGRLAFFVTEILNMDASQKEVILKGAKEFGLDLEKPNFQTTKEVYQFIMDTVLDGMPCDHVNRIKSEEADRIIYERNHCVHEAYWREASGDVANYYEIRQALLEGILEGTGFSIKYNKNQNEIVKLG